MKSLVTLGIVALLAVPVVAEEPRKTQDSQKTEDSALVAAAKKSRERRKKPSATVITNDTLARSSSGKAHVTTTAHQREIKMPEVLPPAEPSAEERAAKVIQLKNSQEAEDTAKAKKALEAKAQRVRAAEEVAHDDYLGDDDGDPADAERRVREAREDKKSTEQKPPHR
ncbi:MAG TPA: hypothetical protein VGF48_00035 [Thermoanaerobaculia bacterium]|jgi:hypothetical protein